jgi:hypothetical protein
VKSAKPPLSVKSFCGSPTTWNRVASAQVVAKKRSRSLVKWVAARARKPRPPPANALEYTVVAIDGC